MSTTTTSASATVRAAASSDLPAIERLLTESKLPTDGVAEAVPDFFVAESNGEIVGVVGMEYRGSYGLLRSTAVSTAWRSRGLARQLVNRIIAEAGSRGVRALYLLTTTAESYFPTFGFERITRDVVPEEIRGTGEFTGVTCSSAAVMRLTLGATSPQT